MSFRKMFLFVASLTNQNRQSNQKSHNINKLWKLKWRIRYLKISFWYSYHFLADALLRGRYRGIQSQFSLGKILFKASSNGDTNEIKSIIIISLWIFLKVVINEVNKAISSKLCVPVTSEYNRAKRCVFAVKFCRES